MGEAQRGDAEAYCELLDELGPIVMKFLRRRVRDAEDARDLYQEVFLSLHRARHTYDPRRPLEPWLFTIARHVVRNYARRVVHRAREIRPEVLPEAAAEDAGHLKPQLEQAIGALSRTQREALILLRVEGVPIEAAARRAGTTVGAMRVRAHRAFRTFRRLL